MSLLVIPAVDIKGGRCVRLFQGRAEQETVFDEHPLAQALRWEADGADYLHVVDLDGAFEGRPVNAGAVAEILRGVSVPVEVGGGIRSTEAAAACVEAGADRVIVGTRAAADAGWLEELVATLGVDRVVAGLDSRSGVVTVEGWTRDAGLTLEAALERLAGAGVRRVIHTEVSTDGALEGPDLDSIGRVALISEGLGIKVIASGGVSSASDVRALNGIRPRLEGAIIGMALYRGAITIEEAKKAAGEA